LAVERSNLNRKNGIRHEKDQFDAGKMKLAAERSNWRPEDGIQALKNKIRGREMEFSTGKTKLAAERSNRHVKNEIRHRKIQMSERKMEFSIGKSKSARNSTNSTAEKPNSRRVLKKWDMGEDFFCIHRFIRKKSH